MKLLLVLSLLCLSTIGVAMADPVTSEADLARRETMQPDVVEGQSGGGGELAGGLSVWRCGCAAFGSWQADRDSEHCSSESESMGQLESAWRRPHLTQY